MRPKPGLECSTAPPPAGAPHFIVHRRVGPRGCSAAGVAVTAMHGWGWCCALHMEMLSNGKTEENSRSRGGSFPFAGRQISNRPWVCVMLGAIRRRHRALRQPLSLARSVSVVGARTVEHAGALIPPTWGLDVTLPLIPPHSSHVIRHRHFRHAVMHPYSLAQDAAHYQRLVQILTPRQAAIDFWSR